MFGSPGNEEAWPSHPMHVAVDGALNDAYVADSRNRRIQKFEINGCFVKSIEQKAIKVAKFTLSTSVVIDSHGDLYVNERGNERVQKLDSEGNPI
jgi:DNA-binding beta-propeller fold protein YncE